LEIAAALCRLIPASAEIELHLAMLRRLVLLDELDLSGCLAPPLAHALISRFPTLPGNRAQCDCLIVLHRTANVCDDRLLFERLMSLATEILTRDGAASLTTEMALLLMIEFVPIAADDRNLARAIRTIFWRHSRIENLVVILMTQFTIKKTGVPLLDSAICQVLFDRADREKGRIVELVDCIFKTGSPDVALLLSHGIVPTIIGLLRKESANHMKQSLMILLARVVQSSSFQGFETVLHDVLSVLRSEMTDGAFSSRVHALLTWITIVKSCDAESVCHTVDDVFLVSLAELIESLHPDELLEVLSGLVYINECQPAISEKMEESGLTKAIASLTLDSPGWHRAIYALEFCHRMGITHCLD
jgi:hypothetical protein